MHIIIFSKTLSSLNISEAKTSSEVFELEFAQALSKKNNVIIISSKALKNEVESNIKLLYLKKSRAKAKDFNKMILKNNISKSERKTIIVFGYDYLTLRYLIKLCKMSNAKLVSYTFDTHKAAIENKGFIIRTLYNMYFYMGIRKLRKVNGVILFNEEAYKEFNLNSPFLISKVGIYKEDINEVSFSPNGQQFCIVYAGSLEKYNGIIEMIEAFKKLTHSNISLHIYGAGVLKEYVIKEISNDTRIKYGGLVSRGELNEVIQKADLLLNLRNPYHAVGKFAFPSKLIQYLATGVPVLSTNVINTKEFLDAAFVIDEFNNEDIKGMIDYIIENPLEHRRRSDNAKTLLKKNYLWEDIILEVNNFIEKV